MAPRKDSLPHETRTAAEPRQNKLHTVRLAHIEQINRSVRLLRLSLTPEVPLGEDTSDEQIPPPEDFSFLPGQWLDVHIPGISQAGGFTITSTPADAQPLPAPDPTIIQDGTEQLLHQQGEFGVPSAGSDGRYPYVELAVQDSPANPSAAWLWRPRAEILGKDLKVRVGGSFVWPPAALSMDRIRRVVFVAGGVGINPLISILSHLTEPKQNSTVPLPDTSPKHPLNIDFLYTTRLPTNNKTSPQQHDGSILEQILFLPRLRNIAQRLTNANHPSNIKLTLNLFLTNTSSSSSSSSPPATDFLANSNNSRTIRVHNRRINKDDLNNATASQRDGDGKSVAEDTVCYVCGPPPMTDEFVQYLETLVGKERVLYEKWW
ncbi:hypothetical protein UA08_04816 [Talaromyces atroroseus]|uniref:FAD-binding FR-type domain-containing protein n=1 Tax=Talaromyces atroroseus TaxID=1441469 RepID=A0A225AFW2_TALAT|nr:hypothetical protein UA08_04816 [Talaromyces atroroseus]OKL60242.1 hypothetical protein UA08_04816 [Talaromyces atroroseus]